MTIEQNDMAMQRLNAVQLGVECGVIGGVPFVAAGLDFSGIRWGLPDICSVEIGQRHQSGRVLPRIEACA